MISSDDDNDEDDSGGPLSSRGLAVLIVDALLRGKVLTERDVERAIKITAEEIDARKGVGDY